MLKVGLTGGLASGKTFVGEILASYGCLLIQADRLGHEAMAPAGGAHEQVIREFGREVLTPDGQIDRRRLAEKVFQDQEALARLNAIVHPLVVRREEQLMAEFAAHDPRGIAVVEGAILIETGSYKRFDRVILVVCTGPQQLERAIHRDGVTEYDVRARIANQMPLEEKRKYAHYLIDTSHAKEDTLRQTRAVYEELRKIEI